MKSASVDSRDVDGNTALHKASYVGNYEGILRLVQAHTEVPCCYAFNSQLCEVKRLVWQL